MNTKLYVGNLSFNTTEDTLREAFAKAGNVRSVSIIKDRDTNQSRGFAFVEMETPADALKAIQVMDGQDVDGRNLRVNEAKPMEPRAGGGFGGGSSGGGGRSGGGFERRGGSERRSGGGGGNRRY